MSVLYNALESSRDPAASRDRGDGAFDEADAAVYLSTRRKERRMAILLGVLAVVVVISVLLAIDSYFVTRRNPSMLSRIDTWLSETFAPEPEIVPPMSVAVAEAPPAIPPGRTEDSPQSDPIPAAPPSAVADRPEPSLPPPDFTSTAPPTVPQGPPPMAAEQALFEIPGIGTPTAAETAQAPAPVARESGEASLPPRAAAPAPQAAQLPSGPISPRNIQAALDRLAAQSAPVMRGLPELDADDPSRDVYLSVSRSGTRTGSDRLGRHAAARDALTAGNTALAEQRYRALLASAGEDVAATLGLATTLHRQGRLDEAEPLYRSVLDRQPDNMVALTNFEALLGAQEPDRAILSLRALEGEYPAIATIPAQRARLHASLGEMEAALEAARRARALDPQAAMISYSLAVIADQAGAAEEARAAYRTVLAAIRGGAAGSDALPRAQIEQRLAWLDRQEAGASP